MKKSTSFAINFLSDDQRKRIIHFVLNKLNPDGGFQGRTTMSDLYYTFFALECLEALNHPIPCEDVESFLTSFKNCEDLDLIHTACLIRCLYKLPKTDNYQYTVQKSLSHLESFKNGSGYKLSRNHSQPSIYATFLAKLVFEEKYPFHKRNEQSLSDFVKFKAKDGAFGDQLGLANGTTPVTAAAVLLFSNQGKNIHQSILQWLVERQTKSGGFLATPYAPIPDLLSTATTLFALSQTGHLEKINLVKAEQFIVKLWHDGGYHGYLLDAIPDCEYTYYGLLGLGCIAAYQRKLKDNDSVQRTKHVLESA